MAQMSSLKEATNYSLVAWRPLRLGVRYFSRLTDFSFLCVLCVSAVHCFLRSLV